MTYKYKIVRVEMDDTDYHSFIKSLSRNFKDQHIISWTYAIIKIGIPKRAKIIVPEFQYDEEAYIKCRCDLAKFIKVERIYLKAINKSTFFATGGDDIQYYDVTNYMKKKYNIKDFRYSSLYKYVFRYNLGEYVKPDKKLDLCSNKECGSGIHFVSSIIDAENYFKINVLQNYYNNVQEGETDGIFSEDGN